MDTIVKKTIKSLQNNKINACYYDSSDVAVEALLSEINLTETVGIGGSVTISSLEIPQKLIRRGNKVFFHWLESTPEKMKAARKEAMNADVYLASTNALTENGQLVNIDGVGNRVAAMIYGPKKVILICGVNKIVPDLDAALEHIKANTYQNARRLNLKTPCAITGKCNDCDSPQRMCSVTTIIDKKPKETEMKVILIGEELGY